MTNIVLLLRIQARYIHYYNFHFLFCSFQFNLFLPKPNQLLVLSGNVVNLNFPNLNEFFSLRTCPHKNFFFFFFHQILISFVLVCHSISLQDLHTNYHCSFVYLVEPFQTSYQVVSLNLQRQLRRHHLPLIVSALKQKVLQLIFFLVFPSLYNPPILSYSSRYSNNVQIRMRHHITF